MATLRKFFVEQSFEEPATVLQSGNIAFGADLSAAELEVRLESASSTHFGFAIEFFVRSAAEFEAAIAANPFLREAEADPAHLLLLLLKQPADKGDVQTLQAAIKGPERVLGEGRDLYLWYPDGIGNSTAPRTPGWNKLIGAGTARNWNTVNKLAALVRG